MKIRMLTGISGPDIDLAPKVDTERFSDAEAIRLMLSDQAEPASDEASAALEAARLAPPAPPAPRAPPPPPPAAAAPPAPQSPAPKPLAEQSVEELRATAKTEGVKLNNFLKDPVKIIAAIEAARAAKA